MKQLLHNNDTIKIAYQKNTKTYKHIDEISNTEKGLKCDCICMNCQEKLEAVIDFKDKKRIKFFRHNLNKDCKGAQETALHELGKQILLNNSEILLPNIIGKIKYLDAIAEKYICKSSNKSGLVIS